MGLVLVGGVVFEGGEGLGLVGGVVFVGGVILVGRLGVENESGGLGRVNVSGVDGIIGGRVSVVGILGVDG